VADLNRAALRRIEEERARLTQACALTHERIGHRFRGAERDLRHVASVIEARDFRRHGFVLATDARGKPVPSISGIHVGAHLDLKFRDGQARVAVRETKEEEK
jgi:exonuclease VII large subunit